MWKVILSKVKAAFPVLTGLLATAIFNPATSQQNIIIDKDNTRPEVTRQYRDQLSLGSFAVTKYNGYNEVSWTTISDADTRGFVVEYSFNGTDFQSAGQTMRGNGSYSIKHYTTDRRPIVYRIKNELVNGRFSYSASKSFDGIEDHPVRLQSTTVRGNVVNVNANRAVQRINVHTGDGTQVYARDLGGQKDFISTTLPSLSKGMYYITFYGDGWKDSQKIMVL
jgi:hypothetical protein